MTFKFNIFKALILWSVLTSVGHAELIQSQESALKKAYPLADRFESRELLLTSAERKAIEAKLGKRIYTVQVTVIEAMAKGKFLGRAFKSQELGKHQPMDSLVALDSAGEVIDVELLVYRETYGGQVRQENFRDQFKHRRFGDALEVGKGIDAVSGATISSKSMALGVRKALLIDDLIRHSPEFNNSRGKHG